jgi:HSP20 family molecular chaperone IbpA
MSSEKSALKDNIESKGKNAYYFAHAKTAKGPQWDKKAEPRLLAKLVVNSTGASDENTNVDSVNSDSIHHTDVEHELDLNDTLKMLQHHKKNRSVAFDTFKSNITKYAFLDENKKVKLYIDLPGVHHDDVCVDLNFDEISFCLVVQGLKSNAEGSTEPTSSQQRCLSFGKLYGNITHATYKVKNDKIVIILTKKAIEKEAEQEESDNAPVYKEWPSIAAKGQDELV